MELTQRKAALVAGLGYLAIFFLAIFANFFVIESIFVTDAAQTAANVDSSQGMLRAGIAAFLAVFAIDVVIAWALYELFKPVSKSLSLLGAWLRLSYTIFLGIAVIPLVLLLEHAPFESFAQMMGSAFNATWLVGLVLFGLHLIVMGMLIRRGDIVPNVLGYVLMVAGAAYVFDTFAQFLFSNYASYASVFLMIVLVPSVIGEMWFTLWLLVKGRTLPA